VVEREHKWHQLEAVLEYIHGRADVQYCTNSELAAEAAA
jgi:hypothetical protein